MSSRRSRSGGTRMREDLQAVVEVLAEAALRDLLLEVAVGRRDDAHVRPASPASRRSARISPSCSTRSSLRLQRERHLRHLVEEERAAVGDLEEALLVLVRAGEAALLVAEELALEQVLRHRGAVLADEELRRAGASGSARAAAMSSLPTPVSPSMSTVTRVSTTLSSCSKSALIAAALPDDLLLALADAPRLLARS